MNHQKSRQQNLTAFFLRAALAGGLMLLSTAGPAAPRMNEGEWEFSMKMQMEGMPINIPATNFSSCMNAKNLVPKAEDTKSKDCKMVDQKQSGDTVSWVMRCVRADTEMDMNGTVTYYGNTMDGKIEQIMKSGGKVQRTASNTISGKRTGPCKTK